MTTRRKRNTLQFDNSTWKLFAERARFRRALSAHKKAHESLLLHSALQQWRNGYPLLPYSRAPLCYALRISFVWRKYKLLHGELHKALLRDRAQHLQGLCSQLDNASKKDIMSKLRPFRLGKRRKDIGKRAQPVVRLENGEIATNPEEALSRWRSHFASMEGGHVTTKEEMFWTAQRTKDPVEFDIHEMPTIFELERQFRQAKPHKAMGLDQVPPELLRMAPRQLAYHLWPWYVKQAFTLSECVQHKGGQLVSVYKRKGNIDACGSHRALLVSSSLSKAFHNTFRRRTMAFVHASGGSMQVSSQLRPSVLTAAHVVRAHLNHARRIGCSSFALFLDISHAFYRVIRQFACGADFSDDHLGKFLQRMGIHDVHISDIAQMLEEGPSLEVLGCRPFLHRHVKELHEGTWFKLAQDHELVHTERGTRPGDGYADVIWALVFSRWIKQLEQRLTESDAFPPRMWNGHIGVCSDIGSQAIPHSLVVWADDVVILGQDEDSYNIVHKLRFACNAMVEELHKYGLQPNFQDGKTEAIIDPRGPRSTRVRRLLFNEWKCRLPLHADTHEYHDLKLVAKYKHLGGIISHGARLRQEISYRTGQGHSTFADYQAKVYKNPHIDLPTRQMVLKSTAFSAMQYGSGTWSHLTQKDLQTWTSAHMNLYRRTLTKLFPFETIRHMTDSDVLDLLMEPHPTISLRLERLRWYGFSLQKDCPTFWATMALEQWWLDEIRQDLSWLYDQIREYTWLPDPAQDPHAWHLLARQHPNRWKKLLARGRLHHVWQQKVQHTVADYHRRALDLLTSAGADFPHTRQVTVDRAYYCFICDSTFATFRGWAVHSFKLHQRINKWRRLQDGHTCLSCAKTFPSSARLIRHLKTVKQCADTVAAAELWVPAEPAFGSKKVTTEEKGLALSTWYHSEQNTLQRQDGWTMTSQTQQLYQLCRALDWDTPGQKQQCLTHLKQLAVCDTELHEIAEALLDTLRSPFAFQQITTTFKELQEQARPEQATVSTPMTIIQCVDALQTTPPAQWKMPKPMGTKYRYILHLFSGVRRQGDLHSILQDLPAPDGHVFFPASIDIVLCSKRGDLTSRPAQDFWLEASIRGAIAAIIGGPPCESWSIARWRYYIELCGPRPIRDGMDTLHQIWAKQPVRIRDLRQLHCANQLLLFMLLLAISQAAAGMCCILEHPACPPRRANGCQPASIWILPLVRYLLRCQNFHHLVVQQGFWGAKSPKPTGLMVVMTGTTDEHLYQIINRHKTQDILPQALPMGKSSTGGYNTAPLKRYTQAFCRGLAAIIEESAKNAITNMVDTDDYHSIFQELRSAYLASADDVDDGADYHNGFPQN